MFIVCVLWMLICLAVEITVRGDSRLWWNCEHKASWQVTESEANEQAGLRFGVWWKWIHHTRILGTETQTWAAKFMLRHGWLTVKSSEPARAATHHLMPVSKCSSNFRFLFLKTGLSLGEFIMVLLRTKPSTAEILVFTVLRQILW